MQTNARRWVSLAVLILLALAAGLWGYFRWRHGQIFVATDDAYVQGKVVAVGPGEWKDGKRVPPSVKVGQTVAFSKYGYDDVTVDGEEYYLIKEENILAVLK